jgi:short-subunit dehydrogenase
VLVVGGSSGIGLASALGYARRGERLVLVSRSESALAQAARQCAAAGAVNVRTVVADVADQAQVGAMIESVSRQEQRLDVVVLTATVMAYGTIEDLPQDVFRTVTDVAIHGTAHLARAVLPIMRAQGSGTFVIVNSLLGSVTVPQMGAYAVAKWGQLALARTLQQETRDAPGVHVCIVSPGSINTPIYYQAANVTGRAARPPWPVIQAERVAAVIVGLGDRPQAHVSVPVGAFNPIIIAGYRAAPFLYDRLVGPLFGLAALTRDHLAASAGNVHAPRPDHERIQGHWPE